MLPFKVRLPVEVIYKLYKHFYIYILYDYFFLVRMCRFLMVCGLLCLIRYTLCSLPLRDWLRRFFDCWDWEMGIINSSLDFGLAMPKICGMGDCSKCCMGITFSFTLLIIFSMFSIGEGIDTGIGIGIGADSASASASDTCIGNGCSEGSGEGIDIDNGAAGICIDIGS